MIKTSIGVQELRRQIAIKAKADTQHRFWGLYCHLWKLDTLMEAYRLTKLNKGAPGIDQVTFTDIETKQGLMPFISEIAEELKTGTYQPAPVRIVKIPKADGKMRTLKIATIKDRVVQGAMKLILEPIFEMDFQDGSFGYRPRRTAHQALARIRNGINLFLYDAIDLDLKSYFDTIRHDILLREIARRVNDPKMMKICKQILKTAGSMGVPQGSLIGPLFSNIYLNNVDKMLEKAKEVTQYRGYKYLEYARFADDLVIIISRSRHSRKTNLLGKVQLRLKQELSKLKVEINEAKTRTINLDAGETLNFLGFTFRLCDKTPKRNFRMAIQRPQREKRTAFLREIKSTMRSHRFKPVANMIREDINPKIRGWVNYFRHGNSGMDLSFVRSSIEVKVRRFATRQTPKKRGGRNWSTWTAKEIYENWGLYQNYKVQYVRE